MEQSLKLKMATQGVMDNLCGSNARGAGVIHGMAVVMSLVTNEDGTPLSAPAGPKLNGLIAQCNKETPPLERQMFFGRSDLCSDFAFEANMVDGGTAATGVGLCFDAMSEEVLLLRERKKRGGKGARRRRFQKSE